LDTSENVVLGIMIPTINRKDLLPLALDALRAQSDDYEIFLLIDNGHQNITETIPKMHMEIMENNLGVSGSWNYGLNWIFDNHPNVTHVLSLSDDCALHSDQLSRIRKLISNNTDMNFFCGNFQWSVWAMNRVCRDMMQHEPGKCFDETFFPAYFEDNDFDWRLRCLETPMHMYSDELTPNIKVVAGSLQKDRSIHDRFTLNRDYYVSKWGGKPGHETTKIPFGCVQK
jgi:GT2 family glycosyltransferase